MATSVVGSLSWLWKNHFAGRRWSISLPPAERRQLAGHHLLLAILLVRQLVEADGVLADLASSGCPGASLTSLSFW